MRRLPHCLAAAVMLLALASCGNVPAPDDGSGSGSAPPPAQARLRPVTAQPVAQDGGLDCPASITDREGMVVPQQPQGVDAGQRLLPDRRPVSLVDCAYPVLDIGATTETGPPYRLRTRTVVTGERVDEVVELLAWAPRDVGRPRGCTAMGGDETVHVLGARYEDAIVWVSSLAEPNRCSTATNGDFVSSLPAGYQLDQWFRPGATPLPATETCPWSQGRLGDDLALVPEGEPAVTVCRPTNAGMRAVPLTPDQSRQVVDALRALRTRATDHTCGEGDPSAGNDFRLVLGYPRGNPVVVSVIPSCRPQLMSGSLAAEDAGPVVSLVEQWSPPVRGYDPGGSVSSTG